MSLWRRLVSSSRAAGDPTAPQRLAARLRRLDRCYRSLHALLADAAEKQGEGFILDRQYVVALVQRTFRHALEGAFHARVLAPRREPDVYRILDDLRERVDALMSGRRSAGDQRLAVALGAVDETLQDRVGRRAVLLAALAQRMQVPVNSGFVVTREGCREIVEHQRRDQDPAGLPEPVAAAIAERVAEVADAAAEARQWTLVLYTLDGDDDGPPIATLTAEADEVAEATATLLTCADTAPRAPRGLAVLCAPVSDSDASGSLFTADPASPYSRRMRLEIEAAGEGSVLFLSRQPPYAALGPAEDDSVLPDHAMATLAAMGERIERFCGRPQEVEWTFSPRWGLRVTWTHPLARPLNLEVTPRDLVQARQRRRTMIAGRGQVACPGVAYGRVFHADDASVAAAPDHAVLVAASLEPQTPLLRVAPQIAAIVLESQTPADPIAVLARAFRIPCLVAATGAMQALPQGTLVTVDADDATVYDGLFEELLHHFLLQREGPREHSEYRLLDDVLGVLGSAAGTIPDERPRTVRGVVEDVYADTLEELSRSAAAEPDRRGDARDPVSVPESHVRSVLDSAEGGAGITTRILASEESVIVIVTGAHGAAMIDASLTGSAEEDHVQLWCAAPAPLLAAVRTEAGRMGMEVRGTERSLSAWSERLPSASAALTLERATALVTGVVGGTAP